MACKLIYFSNFTPQTLTMKKNYFCLLFFLSFTFFSYAQESRNAVSRYQDPTIEGLSVYPNPNNTGKVTIISRQNLEKKVEIFDILGKKVIDVVLYTRELNIASLTPGVYILKIKEGDATATRKLIVN